MSDVIPSSEPLFNLWQAALVTDVQTNTALWGVLPADVATLIAAQTLWTAAYAKGGNKHDRKEPDVQGKDDAYTVYVKALRAFIAQWLSHNPRVSNTERVRMGIPVKTDAHTPASVPTTSPLGILDFSTRSQHTISFTDQETPQSKAKPEGIHGAEVWSKLGAATVYAYLGMCTASPKTIVYDDADANVIATYRLRWVNMVGDEGPWSNVMSATIVG